MRLLLLFGSKWSLDVFAVVCAPLLLFIQLWWTTCWDIRPNCRISSTSKVMWKYQCVCVNISVQHAAYTFVSNATATKYFICCFVFRPFFTRSLCCAVYCCSLSVRSRIKCVRICARTRLCVCRQTICYLSTVARLPQLMARERRKAR